MGKLRRMTTWKVCDLLRSVFFAGFWQGASRDLQRRETQMTRAKWTNPCSMRDCLLIQSFKRLISLCTGEHTLIVCHIAIEITNRATHVPFGEDQQQHLELCRDHAETFNRFFAPDLFPLPTYMGSELRSRQSFSLISNIPRWHRQNVYCHSETRLPRYQSQIRVFAPGFYSQTLTLKYVQSFVGPSQIQ